jgi:hypothetical protein
MAQHELVFQPIPIEEALKARDKASRRSSKKKKAKMSDSKFMFSAVLLVGFSLAIVLLELFLVGSAHVSDLKQRAENPVVVNINQ